MVQRYENSENKRIFAVYLYDQCSRKSNEIALFAILIDFVSVLGFP
jgi:hypothetical protein